MTDSMFTAKARTDLDGRCPEPVETVLLVHPSGRRKKVFGRKQLASRLGINNYLVLTPTHVRLYALGGRTGLKVKDELGAWPRSQVQVRMEMAERSSFMASTGSSLEWRVFCLQLSGPDLDVSVDVRLGGSNGATGRSSTTIAGVVELDRHAAFLECGIERLRLRGVDAVVVFAGGDINGNVDSTVIFTN